MIALLLLLACPSPRPTPADGTAATEDPGATDTGTPTDPDTGTTDTDTTPTDPLEPCEDHDVTRGSADAALTVTGAADDFYSFTANLGLTWNGAPVVVTTQLTTSLLDIRMVPADAVGGLVLTDAPVFSIPDLAYTFAFNLAGGELDAEPGPELLLGDAYADAGAPGSGEIVIASEDGRVLRWTIGVADAALGENLHLADNLFGPGEAGLVTSARLTQDGGTYAAVYRIPGEGVVGGDVDTVAISDVIPTEGGYYPVPELASYDPDGDGTAALVLGAGWDGSGGTGEGRVWILEAEDTLTDPGARLASPNRSTGFASAVWSPGDLDGDGHEELAVSEPRTKDPGAPGGRVLIYTGTLTGEVDVESAAHRVHATIDGQALGFEGARVGDVDGDGRDELAVQHSSLGTVAPAEWLVFTCTDAEVLTEADADLVVENPYGGWGTNTLASVPDVDGDGILELALGIETFEPPEGGLWLFRSTETWGAR